MQNREFSVDLLEKLGFFMAHIPDVSEDCLYLNIYTPAKRAHNTKLPVRRLCCIFGAVLLTENQIWLSLDPYSKGNASEYTISRHQLCFMSVSIYVNVL